jgi:hypothetical protein
MSLDLFIDIKKIHAFLVGMYIRTIKRKNKDGSEVEYVQLAHNTRHTEKGYSQAEVIHSFGRRDHLDVAALKRLVNHDRSNVGYL